MYDRDGRLLDRREMLRVKVKSLSDESRIIRKEEGKTVGALRDELHLHRVGIVRAEARATHLAYGLIRGRTVERMEREGSSERTEMLWKKVRGMVERYGPVRQEERTALLERCR